MSEEYDQAIAHIQAFKQSGDPAAMAHAHSSRHRAEIERSGAVGWSLIHEWVDDEKTALCPRCGIDSVIGSASGFPISDKAFLKAMNEAWF